MSLGNYHRSLLNTIYDAHDRLREIPREHWNALDYFNLHKSKTAMGFFGHYVLLLPEFRATDPKAISNNTYMVKAAPLANAINTFLSIMLDDKDDEYDAYSIVNGKAPNFPQKHPYDRAMALFEFIEKGYPRNIHRSSMQNDIVDSDVDMMPLGKLDQLSAHAHKI